MGFGGIRDLSRLSVQDEAYGVSTYSLGDFLPSEGDRSADAWLTIDSGRLISDRSNAGTEADGANVGYDRGLGFKSIGGSDTAGGAATAVDIVFEDPIFVSETRLRLF